MLVSMYMTPDVAHVPSGVDASRAVELMARRRVRSLPVVDKGALVGVISRSDILRATPARTEPFAAEERARDLLGFSVGAAMVGSVVTVAPDDSIERAVGLLDTHRLNSLVVVDDGQPVGVISRTDILRAFREIVFAPAATRFTLSVDEGVDVMAALLGGGCLGSLTLAAYAEHRNHNGRYVLLTVGGEPRAVDDMLEAAWGSGVRVLKVERPSQAPSA